MRYFIAISYFALFCIILRTLTRIDPRVLIYGICMLFILSGFSVFIYSTGFIEEKVASFVSFDIHNGQRFTLTFFVQYLLLYIPFELFNYEYSAHGLNIALQAFFFMLCLQYVFKVKLSWQLYVFALFPSYYHYSVFGLRDPLINLTVALVTIAALNLSVRKFVFVCCLLAIVNVGIRPEFSLILLGFAGLRLLFESKGWYTALLLIFGMVVLYAGLLVMPLAFGMPATGSVSTNLDTMITFNELRNSRRIGEYGSGSHILGGVLFSYPFLLRYPIQIVASFLSPLPMDIRGLLDIAAFIESVLFCIIVFIAFKGSLKNRVSRFLFACGVLYMFLQALFAINYGNILRVRYPCLILFLAASLPLTDTFRVSARKSVNPSPSSDGSPGSRY